MNVRRVLQAKFYEALKGLGEEAAELGRLVKPTANPRFGDYQANCAMPLARKLGRPPRELAADILQRLDLEPIEAGCEVAGPGFINIRLDDRWLERQLAQLAADERLGVPPAEETKTIVIDFSSPNIAKPMHVGHIRSTIIGDSLARLLRFLKHHVVTDNHLGDWGTQFGMLIFGYKHLLDEQAYAERPVDELARLYKLVNWLCEGAQQEWEEGEEEFEAEEANGPGRAEQFAAELAERAAAEPKLAALAARFDSPQELARYVAEESRNETRRLHEGDPENHRLWQSFMPHCLAELERIYRRLEVHFDHQLGESFYQPMLAAVVDELLRLGIAEISEGAVCVFLDRDKPPCVIRKRDGAYLYATTDLATIKYRVEKFRPNAILYVVDRRQSLHFEQLFEVARRWGYSQVQFVHVSFGTIRGKDGRPFRTRAGGTVGLEELLEEAVQRARRVVDENSPHLPEEDRRHVAEAVGIGAIKYADLAVDRTSDYVFDWDKMMAMQGNTGTYMQYAYARVQSIFRKGGVEPANLRAERPAVTLTEPTERALALRLIALPEAIEDAAADMRPSVLANYLYSLADAFSSFYTTCPVLKAQPSELRLSRLMLCDLTGRIIQLGLELLGIRTPERM